VGATEVRANFPGGAADEQAVVPAVHGELVAPRRHLAPERQVPGRRGAEQEERRADVVLGEHVQEARGRQAPRAVVERQRHVIGIAESRVPRHQCPSQWSDRPDGRPCVCQGRGDRGCS
jgi:hypothetical protein